MRALAELKRLKKLHIYLFDEEAWLSADALSDKLHLSLEEAESRLRTYAALRKANPRLVIDEDEEAIYDDVPNTFDDHSAPRGESIPAYSPAEFYARMVQDWKVKQAGKAKLQGAVNSTPPKSRRTTGIHFDERTGGNPT